MKSLGDSGKNRPLPKQDADWKRRRQVRVCELESRGAKQKLKNKICGFSSFLFLVLIGRKSVHQNLPEAKDSLKVRGSCRTFTTHQRLQASGKSTGLGFGIPVSTVDVHSTACTGHE